MEIPLFSRKWSKRTSDNIPSDEDIALRVISRFSRGNIRMQQGAILTREELDVRAKLREKQIKRLLKLYKIDIKKLDK
ncbi:hypothetical protein [Thermopetrobacter sp. TC1]|uniref:hypothetical protein n=1 Tax=Thermopetrobacter sp. TC1 TaxID=1495045 RepID=UPI000571E38D|nr:hypothetical protein [Thermopetrobacter sp. TC1]